MGFPENLKNARDRMGYSQAELAELSGVGKNTIYNYENGKSFPKNRTTINRLADALNISTIELISDDPNIVLKTPAVKPKPITFFAGGQNQKLTQEDIAIISDIIDMKLQQYFGNNK